MEQCLHMGEKLGHVVAALTGAQHGGALANQAAAGRQLVIAARQDLSVACHDIHVPEPPRGWLCSSAMVARLTRSADASMAISPSGPVAKSSERCSLMLHS